MKWIHLALKVRHHQQYLSLIGGLHKVPVNQNMESLLLNCDLQWSYPVSGFSRLPENEGSRGVTTGWLIVPAPLVEIFCTSLSISPTGRCDNLLAN